MEKAVLDIDRGFRMVIVRSKPVTGGSCLLHCLLNFLNVSFYNNDLEPHIDLAPCLLPDSPIYSLSVLIVPMRAKEDNNGVPWLT